MAWSSGESFFQARGLIAAGHVGRCDGQHRDVLAHLVEPVGHGARRAHEAAVDDAALEGFVDLGGGHHDRDRPDGLQDVGVHAAAAADLHALEVGQGLDGLAGGHEEVVVRHGPVGELRARLLILRLDVFRVELLHDPNGHVGAGVLEGESAPEGQMEPRGVIDGVGQRDVGDPRAQGLEALLGAVERLGVIHPDLDARRPSASRSGRQPTGGLPADGASAAGTTKTSARRGRQPAQSGRSAGPGPPQR